MIQVVCYISVTSVINVLHLSGNDDNAGSSISCKIIYIVLLIGSVEGEGGEAGGGDGHLSGGERLCRGCDQHQVQVQQIFLFLLIKAFQLEE